MPDQPKPVPLLSDAEVDALLEAVAATVLSPEAATVAEAARARLLRPPLQVIDGGAGGYPDVLDERAKNAQLRKQIA